MLQASLLPYQHAPFAALCSRTYRRNDSYVFAILPLLGASDGKQFTVALGHLPEDRKADGNAVINTLQQLMRYGHQRYLAL